MSSTDWIKLEPYEADGERDGWHLVVEWDSDWQDWTLEGVGAGRQRLTVHVPDEMVAGLNLARS